MSFWEQHVKEHEIQRRLFRVRIDHIKEFHRLRTVVYDVERAINLVLFESFTYKRGIRRIVLG